MPHDTALQSFIRVVCILLSLILYVLLFLRENEERRLQSSLDELWIRVDDAGRTIGSFLSALLAEVAKLTNAGIDRVFGPALMSKQAVGVAVSYGLASMFITAMLMSNIPVKQMWIAAALLIFVGSFPAISMSRDAVRKVFLIPVAFCLFLIGMSLWLGFMLIRAPDQFELSGGLFAAIYVFFASIAAAVVLDGVWLVLMRVTLKWFVRRQTPLRSITFLGINAAAFGVSLLPLVERDTLGASLGSGGVGTWLALFLICLSSTRLFMAVTAFAFLWLMAIVLTHRIVWPVIDRLIYAAARHRLLHNKKMLASLASALLMAGAWNAKPLVAVLNLLGLK
jgi:hypothetical protein